MEATAASRRSASRGGPVVDLGGQGVDPGLGEVAGGVVHQRPHGRPEAGRDQGRGRRQRGSTATAFAAAEVEPAERVRPQAPGPPGDGPARAGDGPAAVRSGDRRRDRVHPRNLGERRRQRRAQRAVADRRGRLRTSPASLPRAGGAAPAECGRRRCDVGLEPLDRHLPGADPFTERLPKRLHPALGTDRCRHQGDVGEPVGREQAAQVGATGVELPGGEPVGLVQRHQQHALVPGQGLEVPLVDGPVGVLLRIEDPDDDVGDADHPVDLTAMGGGGGVVIRQVEEHEAVEAGVAGALGQAMAALARASQSSSGPASAPHVQADVVDVVGRRTPTVERSSPANALKSEDLPLPVAPARATTVWSRPWPRRSPARRTNAPATGDRSRFDHAGAGVDRLLQGLEALVERRAVTAATADHGDVPGPVPSRTPTVHGLAQQGRAAPSPRPRPPDVEPVGLGRQQRARPPAGARSGRCGPAPGRPGRRTPPR